LNKVIIDHISLEENAVDEELLQEMFELNMEIQDLSSLAEYERIKAKIDKEADLLAKEINTAFNAKSFQDMLALLNRLAYFKKALGNLDQAKELLAKNTN
jgi:hypothetical protein